MFHGTLKGAYYFHLMGHKSSFSEMIMTGKQVDLGIKLGRIEGPTKKGEGESSRKTASAATPTGGRRSKEASVNAVNAGHNAPQQYSMSFTSAPSTTPAYAPLPSPYPSQHSAQPAPAPQGQQGGATQTRQRKQFTPMSAALSHIYQQLITGKQIQPIAPNSGFDPTIQDRSWHYEYHSGAPGHNTDNCWKLREKIQQMIDEKKLVFNAARPPNVQANPFPDHGSSSGPTINMINVCTIREYEAD
ncbi:hypothetical protein CRG98_004805 [Punica granatum]|uniref:Uncharacterized protein n=1 Tax=Punica granatum TaxID=22663 RepID=A0A2I0L253_PUNGR|nr:hypothetical protein CRG98_004805 [Punica granatum]